MIEDPPAGSVKTAAADDYLVALAQAHHTDAVMSGNPHLLEAPSDEMQVLMPRELVRSPGCRACRLTC